MAPEVIAFDIDGALTEQGGVERFKELQTDDNVIVGIVTARSIDDRNQFVRENNLNPDFARSTRIKYKELNQIQNVFLNADNFIYIGSWFRDRFAAWIAGWEYKQL